MTSRSLRFRLNEIELEALEAAMDYCCECYHEEFFDHLYQEFLIDPCREEEKTGFHEIELRAVRIDWIHRHVDMRDELLEICRNYEDGTIKIDQVSGLAFYQFVFTYANAIRFDFLSRPPEEDILLVKQVRLDKILQSISLRLRELVNTVNRGVNVA